MFRPTPVTEHNGALPLAKILRRLSQLTKRSVREALVERIGAQLFLEDCAYKRIGVAVNKELSNIAAHVGELWCAMWTRFEQF